MHLTQVVEDRQGEDVAHIACRHLRLCQEVVRQFVEALGDAEAAVLLRTFLDGQEVVAQAEIEHACDGVLQMREILSVSVLWDRERGLEDTALPGVGPPCVFEVLSRRSSHAPFLGAVMEHLLLLLLLSAVPCWYWRLLLQKGGVFQDAALVGSVP